MTAFFVAAPSAFAAPRYQPGETLNPDCGPGESDCTVALPTGNGEMTINGEQASEFIFNTGSVGSDFSISTSSNVVTFTIPNAGSFARGLVSTGTQIFAGDKTFSGNTTFATATVSYLQIGDSSLPDFVKRKISYAVTNNAESLISANYNSATSKIDFSVESDLSKYSNTVSRFLAYDSLSENIDALSYNPQTGSFSLTPGYTIPTTASTTAWDTAFTNSHNALTVGTGNGLSVNGTQVLSLARAGANTTGALSNTDWTLFNNKENALTINGNGLFSRTGNTINAAACSNNQILRYNGSAWVCDLDNDIDTNTTYSAGLGILLSGTTFSFDSDDLDTVSSATGDDEIVVSIDGVPKRITYDNLLGNTLGSMNYQGTWDANTNTPSLTTAPKDCVSGNKGHFYVVDEPGSTDLDGNTTWNTGDWAVCSGTEWQRVQTTSGVASVFGRAGAITAQTGDYNANQVTFNSTSTISAIDVEGAINELNAEKLATTLASGKLLIGNASDIATAIQISGDATIDNTGVLTIADNSITTDNIAANTIVNNDISDTANIALSKLANGGTIVTALGAPTGSYANGGTISDHELRLSYAGAVNPGIVSTTTQTFAGEKTFANTLTLSSLTNGILRTNGSGVVSTGAIDISGDTNLSVTATGLTLDGDAIALSNGYVVPTVASTTAWDDAAAHTYSQTPSVIRGFFSNTATGLSYNSGNGETSLDTGYVIPQTTEVDNWNNFYNTPSTRIMAGTNLSWSGNTLNSVFDTAASRAAWSESVAGLSYNTGTGVLTTTSGYVIPTTASTTRWEQAYASTTAQTPSYIRGLFSNTATGLSYDSATGNTSLASNYVIPTTASTTAWDAAVAASHEAIESVGGSYDYITLSNQELILNQIDLATDVTGTLPTGSFVTGGNWTGTFDGQEGSYYLSRANQTGTQLASTISDFVSGARAVLSSSVDALSYNPQTGSFSLTPGYTIPTTASTTAWDTAFTNSHNALTVGTGNGLSVNGTQVLSLARAGANTTGALSNTDWTLFNNKENALTINGNGLFSRTGNTINAAACSNNQILRYNGSAWVCDLDNDIDTNTTYSAGLGILLSGTTFSFDSDDLDTVSSATGDDEIVVSIDGVPKRITYDNLLGNTLGSMNYQGTWDANTNTPSLTTAPKDCVSGNKGHFYVVDEPGSTDLDGNTTWNTGDWAVCSGTEWQRVQTTSGVASVFGRAGAITAQTGDYNANQVTFNSTSTISAIDVEGAINELNAEKLATTLASGKLLIGNASDIATAIQISGDATIDNTGVLTIADNSITTDNIAANTIVNNDISDTANIALSKLANGGTIVTALGAPTGSYANGGTISDHELRLSYAGAVNPGIVSTTTQTFAGEKTFANTLTLSSLTNGILRTNGSGVVSTGAIDISGDTNLSVTATGLTLDGDAIALSNGYVVPTVASTTAWDDATGRAHDAVTLAGTLDYLTLSNQVLTLSQIDLATDITGTLPTGSFATGGNWSGTFDGQEGTYYLSRANQTGTQLASTISDFTSSARGTLSAGSGILYNTSTGVIGLDASGNWSGTFDGQEGSYYLSRANQTGTQLASTISDFTGAARSTLSAGSGIIYNNTSGSVSLNSSGNWAGTFDGQEGSYYLNLANHSGTLSVPQGGTGASSLTGLLLGNGLSPFTATSTLSASFIEDAYVRNTGDAVSGNLTFSGTAANIALGTNWLSGDGADEGVYVAANGAVGLRTVPAAGMDVDILGRTQLTYNGADATAVTLDASASSINNNAALKIMVPSTGAQKGFSISNGADEYAWSSFEYNVGGTGKPGFAFGTGGAFPRDTNIYRDAANVLKTDDTFVIGDRLQQLGSGNSYFTGNLGIGTTAPSSKLTVSGDIYATGALLDSTNSAGTNGYLLQTTGLGTKWVSTSTLGIGGGGGDYVAKAGDTMSGNLAFSGSAANIALGTNWLSGDGADEGIYVTNAGNIGIGTTVPSARLSNTAVFLQDYAGVPVSAVGLIWEVNNNARYAMGISNTNTAANTGGLLIKVVTPVNGTSKALNITNGTTEIATINHTGAAFKPGGGSWSATSDARSKRNVKDLTLGLDAVLELRPVTYEYNGNFGTLADSKVYTGVIAQEANETPFGEYAITTDEYDGQKFLRWDSTAMTYALVNAVKDLYKMISDQAEAFTTKTLTAIKGTFGRVETDELCVNKSNGEAVCITGDELSEMLQESNQSPSQSSQSTSQGDNGSNTKNTATSSQSGAGTTTQSTTTTTSSTNANNGGDTSASSTPATTDTAQDTGINTDSSATNEPQEESDAPKEEAVETQPAAAEGGDGSAQTDNASTTSDNVE